MCQPFMVREDEDLEGTETVSVFLTSRDLDAGDRRMIVINILDINSNNIVNFRHVFFNFSW